ncbi:MAG: dTDP-4-dehydrorhamnose reductase [Sutterellaceae bacterium]|nr:dTDP-4-dehydrorhamnose reductase [Sutterellaceae bacterium]
MTVKVLILGAAGQVGAALTRFFADMGNIEVTALTRKGEGKLTGDITDFEGVRQTIETLRPDIVFNASAYTDVRKSETDFETAKLVNSDAVVHLAQCVKDTGGLFVHYSTDYVFDGTSDRPYLEDDATNPINRYGLSKLMGEEGVTKVAGDYLIFRTTWVVSSDHACFLTKMLANAAKLTSIKIVSDQVGVPATADFIAEVSGTVALDKKSNRAIANGIYHLVPEGKTDWASFTRWIVANADEETKKTLTLTPEAVESITTETYQELFPQDKARRPKNSLLNNAKLKAVYAGEIADWTVYCTKIMEEIGRKHD